MVNLKYDVVIVNNKHNVNIGNSTNYKQICYK